LDGQAQAPSIQKQAQKLLSKDEKKHASSYAFTTLTNNYTFSRALLRILLTYSGLNSHAQNIHFTYNCYGKPNVCEPNHGSNIPHFSLSHTEHQVLIAIRYKTHLGVDLEQILPIKDNLSLAKMCFSQRELQCMYTNNSPHSFFYHIWSRKEAWLKAVGLGLINDLHELDVSNTEPIYQQKATGYTCLSLAVKAGNSCAISYPELNELPLTLYNIENPFHH